MTAPRFRLARERAGLSLGHAAKHLEVSSDELEFIEAAQTVDTCVDVERMAEIYGVNVAWLIGAAPQHDYDAMKHVPGYDRLTTHDRDVVAEFAASLPGAKGTAVERLARVRKAKGNR